MTPVTQIPVHEAIIASAWGHTEASWLALTELERAWARTGSPTTSEAGS